MMIVKVSAVTVDSDGTHHYTGKQQEFDVGTGSYVDSPCPMTFGSSGPYLVELNNQPLQTLPCLVVASHRGMKKSDGNEVWEFNRPQLGFWGRVTARVGTFYFTVKEVTADPSTYHWNLVTPGYNVTACETNNNPDVPIGSVVWVQQFNTDLFSGWRFLFGEIQWCGIVDSSPPYNGSDGSYRGYVIFWNPDGGYDLIGEELKVFPINGSLLWAERKYPCQIVDSTSSPPVAVALGEQVGFCICSGEDPDGSFVYAGYSYLGTTATDYQGPGVYLQSSLQDNVTPLPFNGMKVCVNSGITYNDGTHGDRPLWLVVHETINPLDLERTSADGLSTIGTDDTNALGDTFHDGLCESVVDVPTALANLGLSGGASFSVTVDATNSGSLTSLTVSNGIITGYTTLP